MNITVTHGVPVVTVPKSETAPIAAPKAEVRTEAPARLAQDVVKTGKIDKGIVPTLKGAGAGFAGGALAAGVPIGLLALGAKSGVNGEGAIVFVMLGAAAAVVGATSGTLAGAVAANSTTSKGKGALIGAGVGALTGAGALGVWSKGNTGSMVVGAVAGAVIGAAGGFAGSLVAKTN